MSNSLLAEQLEALERSMAERTMDPAEVGPHIHRDFIEFGKSGRVWTREEVVASLINESPRSVEMHDFGIRELTERVVLVTYRSALGDGVVALRSSVWVLEDGRWQMFFHQGTRISAASGEA